MMALTMEAQIEQLDQLLLQGILTQFPDRLTEYEKASLHAYVVLSHAVIEESIEDTFVEHLDKLCGWLGADLVPSDAARMLMLLAEKNPEILDARKKYHLPNVGAAARSLYRKQVIKVNHGIRAKNLKALALGAGLDVVRFEGSLAKELVDLDTLGSKRGEAGHLSPFTGKSVAITWHDYPENAREWVADAVGAANGVVLYLYKLVASQQPQTLIGDCDGN